jgi:hypothetical protein
MDPTQKDSKIQTSYKLLLNTRDAQELKETNSSLEKRSQRLCPGMNLTQSMPQMIMTGET